MWNVMLVEDQAIVRQGLKAILEQDEKIRVTLEAENGQKAIDLMEGHMVDFIMMDVRMPVMNGIEATRKIKKRWPEVKIVILTTFNDDEYAMEALREGANGYLLKTAEPMRLIEAVYSCMGGGLTIHDEVAAKVVPRLLRPGSQDDKVILTPRELAIARMVGEGKTNKEISEELFLSVGTVKIHVTAILHKTDLRDRTQLAIYAVKNGLV